MEKILITGHTLTLEELAAVCRDNAPVALAPEAKQRILESRQVVDMLVDEAAVVYGITTGFGKFSDVTITQDECRQLQRNLIVTHAVGAGDPFPRDVARGIMLLRVNNLAKGFSGTRLELVETLVAMLNRGVTPVIPQKGSLGASGDLAPLSHMVLPMLGLGQAEYEGEVLPGDVAMERAGIPTVELVAKEGLALINGTQAMTSVGALAVYDAIGLMKAADIAAAMSFEANRGVEDALDPRVHAVRPHDDGGQSAQPPLRQRQRDLPGGDPGPGRLLPALCAPGPWGQSGRHQLREVQSGNRDERRHRQPHHLQRDHGGHFRRQLPRSAHGSGL